LRCAENNRWSRGGSSGPYLVRQTSQDEFVLSLATLTDVVPTGLHCDPTAHQAAHCPCRKLSGGQFISQPNRLISSHTQVCSRLEGSPPVFPCRIRSKQQRNRSARRMHHDSTVISIRAAIAWAVVVGALFTAPVRAAPLVTVDIPAGPVFESLSVLAREARLQIIFRSEDLQAINTRSVSGNLEPREAFRRLLAGTGLGFRFSVSGVVVVFPVPAIAGRVSQGGRAPRSPSGADFDEPSTVVVRAPAVRGEIPNLVGIDMLVVGREDIEKSGLTTTPGLVNTLPQNFGGGPNENTTRGGGAESNSGSGGGVNLRGLSDDGTIVLVNGRRLAPSGTVGAFTDIANIPLAAVDHMDVIAEGATARYGADAIGGIVNFVTRQDEGFETQADVGGLAKGAVYQERFSQSYGARWGGGSLFTLLEYDEHDALPAGRRALATSDLTAYGGQNFDGLYGNPGTIGTYSASGAYITWAIPHGQNGLGVTPSQLVPNTQNLYDQNSGTTILPRQQLSSLVFSGRQELAGSWSVFVDILLSQRLARSATHGEEVPISVRNSNPFYVNPVGGTGPITVFYNGFGPGFGAVLTHADVNTGQITAGVNHAGGIFGHFEMYASYAYERQHQIQDGLVNPYTLEAYLNDPNPSTAANVFGDGSNTNSSTLAAIRAQGSLGLTSQLRSANFTADRVLFHMPGGDALLIVSDEYRKQSFDSYYDLPGVALEPLTDLERTTLSTFAMTRVPIVGPNNRVKGIESLELSAAIRYEHYSDVGATTVPQFALAYTPVRRVLLRGTWARLSHPPRSPGPLRSDEWQHSISSSDLQRLVYNRAHPQWRQRRAETRDRQELDSGC
jgi:iron complex outermembrane receptor protein